MISLSVRNKYFSGDPAESTPTHNEANNMADYLVPILANGNITQVIL